MKLKKLLALAAIPAMALALTACGGKKAPPKAPGAAAGGAPVEVTAEQYFADFQKDKKAAEAKYNGKPVKLTGVVRDIMDGTQGVKTDSAILLVGDPKDSIMGNVAATVTNDKLADIKKLKPGAKLTVTCTGVANPILPTCKDATIVK